MLEAHRVHHSTAMSKRGHLGLRLFGLLLLGAAALWPRSRGAHHDRAIGSVAESTHLVVTTAARLDRSEGARPRAAKPELEVDATESSAADPALTN